MKNLNLLQKMAGNQQLPSDIFNNTQDICILEFFENIELMAKANGRDDETKLVYLPLYLKGSVLLYIKQLYGPNFFKLVS